MEIMKPSFVQFTPRTFLLSQERISLKHAKALRAYMGGVKNIDNKRIQKLIVDSCQMSDQVFSEILEGVLHQSDLTENKLENTMEVK